MSKVLTGLSNFFKLASMDMANQYALPVKSVTGMVVSKWTARSSRKLNRNLIEHLNIKPDDYLLELGYGRGDAIGLCFEKVSSGDGMVFGIERSGYMDQVTRKRYDLEIAETSKIRLESSHNLRNLPFPSNLFDHIYHTDLFYFISQEDLTSVLTEMCRVLKPGGRLTCAMQFRRLDILTGYNLLDKSQWNPVRYLESLEQAEFTNIDLSYHEDSEDGEYQLIAAQKSEDSIKFNDPEEIMRQLELDIKRERLAVELARDSKRKLSSEELKDVGSS